MLLWCTAPCLPLLLVTSCFPLDFSNVTSLSPFVTSTDGSKDCNCNISSATKPSSSEIVLARVLLMMIFLLVIIGLLRMLYCCHGKRIHQTDSRKQLTYDPDHDDFREKKEEQRNETHVIHASKASTNSCSVLYITLTGCVPIVCFRLQRPSESQTTLITN